MSGFKNCTHLHNFKKITIMKKIIFSLIVIASAATLAFTTGDPLKIGSI
jgi:hypothetical protein